jgi:hypothetical protein
MPMPKKRRIVPLPETNADLHYPESLPLAEREKPRGRITTSRAKETGETGGREDLKPESIQRTARRKSEQF